MKQFETGRLYNCQCGTECGMTYEVARRDNGNLWVKLNGYRHQCVQRKAIKHCLNATEYIEEASINGAGMFLIAANVQPVPETQEVFL